MKVVVSDGLLDAAPFPPVEGLELAGSVTSRAGLPEGASTLSVWQHELAPGARIDLSGAAADHAFYVQLGEVRIGDEALGAHCAVCVGRGGVAILAAGDEGATVLHYLGDAETRPDKPGGCVHVLHDRGILAREDRTGGFHRLLVLYADSDCPTCSVWLHKQNNEAGKFTHPHAHSADEVISVIEGGLLLGTRALNQGGSVAVAKDSFYSFRTGPSGLTFLNFRQDDPTYLKKGADPSQRKSEREMIRRGVVDVPPVAQASQAA